MTHIFNRMIKISIQPCNVCRQNQHCEGDDNDVNDDNDVDDEDAFIVAFYFRYYHREVGCSTDGRWCIHLSNVRLWCSGYKVQSYRSSDSSR